MMFYLLWIPICITLYVGYAYLSYKNQISPATDFKFLAGLFVLQACGLWPIVSKYSNNLVFDALLYDTLLIFTFYATMIFLGQIKNFHWIQYTGFALATIGILLIKTGEFLYAAKSSEITP